MTIDIVLQNARFSSQKFEQLRALMRTLPSLSGQELLGLSMTITLSLFRLMGHLLPRNFGLAVGGAPRRLRRPLRSFSDSFRG